MVEEALDLHDIERRLDAVGSVAQVVRAIWALARGQIPLCRKAVEEATVYLDWVDEVVDRVAGPPTTPTGTTRLVVVLGPERPFCGALPRQVLEQLPATGKLGIVGARLWEIVGPDAALRARVAFHTASASAHDEHEEVAHRVSTLLLAHAAGAQVELLYPRHAHERLHRVVLLAGERRPSSNPPDTFSPIEEIVGAAVSEALRGRLAVGVAECLLAELHARVVAAEHARAGCDERLTQLEKRWQSARQEQITGELIEVIAGRTAALERA